jgi:Flp pilus assembly protein TadG
MASLTRRVRRGSDETGAELIEFAIVLPILLLVVAAIMDFGFLFQRYEVVTNAAREGARVAVLPGYGVTQAQARVQNYLTASGLTASAPAPTVTYGTQTLPGGLVVSTATVTVQYPSQFAFIGPIAAMIGGTGWGTVTLQASSVMRVEGAGS